MSIRISILKAKLKIEVLFGLIPMKNSIDKPISGLPHTLVYFPQPPAPQKYKTDFKTNCQSITW